MARDLMLQAAILGHMEQEINAARDFFEDCAQRAVFETAAEFQALRRIDWASSGIKRASALQKTVRLRKFVNKGKNPAALVYSTIPIIEQSFEDHLVIRSPRGTGQLIPNPEVWGNDRVSLPRGRSAAAKDILAIAERRFGRLRLVFRRTGLSLLVTDARESKARPGSFRHASKTAERTGRGLATIIVFFIVMQTTHRRRLHGDVLRKRWERTGPEQVQQRFVKYFEEGPETGQKALSAPSGSAE
jgi:hypothetical protein